MNGKTALYRYYDKHENLLYVGISFSAMNRLIQHKSSAKWADKIIRMDIEWFNTRIEAEKAEKKAIKKESPQFNIIHARKLYKQRPANKEKPEIRQITADPEIIKANFRRLWGTIHEAIRDTGLAKQTIYRTIENGEVSDTITGRLYKMGIDPQELVKETEQA